MDKPGQSDLFPEGMRDAPPGAVAAFQQRIAELAQQLLSSTNELTTLRERYGALQAILNQIPLPFSITNSAGRFVLANAPFGKLLHQSPEQIIGKTAAECFAPEVTRVVQQHDQQVLTSQKPLTTTEPLTPDTVAPVEVIKFPFLTSEGAVSAIGSIVVGSAPRNGTHNASQHAHFAESILDSLSAHIAVLDENSDIIAINRAWREFALSNPPVSDAIAEGANYLSVCDAADGDCSEGATDFAAGIRAVLAGERDSFAMEYPCHSPDEQRWYIGHVTRLIGSGPGRVVIAHEDITQRKLAEHALQTANEQLTYWIDELEQRNRDMTLLNEMNDFLQSCQTVSEAYEVFALIAEHLFTDHIGALYCFKADHERLERVVQWGAEQIWAPTINLDSCMSLRRGRSHTIDHTSSSIYCSNLETTSHMPYICVPLTAQSEVLGVLRLGSSSADATRTARDRERWQRLAVMVADNLALALSNLQLRARLQQQAIRDSLTGLFNRRYLDETLEREMQRAERHQHSIGLIMIDIDHFKRFNDIYGHQVGDLLLQAVGQFLRTHTRGEDIACRYGGEEFILALPEASLEETRRRAEHVRTAMKHIFVEYSGKMLGGNTISLGVAVFPTHGKTARSLIDEADRALYRAKAAGRDCVIVAADAASHTVG
jgi:diguanylate cyclase (GGDEF)-like protein/PAS domain S-box-containing protein